MHGTELRDTMGQLYGGVGQECGKHISNIFTYSSALEINKQMGSHLMQMGKHIVDGWQGVIFHILDHLPPHTHTDLALSCVHVCI